MSNFEKAEYLDRLHKAQRRMAEDNIDALLITCPENMYYLTGYSGESYYTHQMVIIGQDADEPVLVLRDMDTACADHTVFMKPENIIGYPESYIGADAHPQQFIADVVRQKGYANKVLGVEMDTHFFTARAYLILLESLPDATFKDAFLLVNWLRTYKSPAELCYMREAGKIAENALQTAIDAINPGVPECDVAAKIAHAQISGTPEFGGLPSYFAMPSGERAAAPHLNWTDGAYPDNTAVNIELGGKRHFYCAGLSRSIYLGTPPDELIKLSTVVIDGLDQALEAVRPGNLCEDVERAWRECISKAGYEKPSRIGYSIGIELCPDWIDLTASLQAGDKTTLEPGMTFHMICGMWKGEHNFVVSETFAVTHSGYELMSNLERRLFIKD